MRADRLHRFEPAAEVSVSDGCRFRFMVFMMSAYESMAQSMFGVSALTFLIT